jgi:hypothetical protein
MIRLQALLRVLAIIPLCGSVLHSQATWDRLRPFEQGPGGGRAVTDWTPQAIDSLSISDAAKYLAYYKMNSRLLTFAHERFMQTQADHRTDKQVVAGSAAGGTGDPVAMPGLPELLAYAVSTGVVSQTVNQNVTTFSVNGDGFYRFLAGENPACSGADPGVDDQNRTTLQDSCKPPSWANNLSVSAAFNMGTSTQTVTGQSAVTGTMQSALVNVNGKDFSSASLRYAPTNTRSPKSTQSSDRFRGVIAPGRYLQFQGPGGRLLEYIANLLRSEISASEFNNFRSEVPNLTLEDSPRNPPVRVFDAWHRLVDALGQELENRAPLSRDDEEAFLVRTMTIGLELLRTKEPAFDEKVEQLSESYLKYLTRDAVTGADLVHSAMVTADYTFSRPPLEPDLHTFTFVFSFSPGATNSTNPLTLTANLGTSIYAKPQPTDAKGDSGTLRNIQSAFQFDRSWNASQTPIQVSLGGYFQYQVKPGIINVPSGATIPGTSIMVPGNASMLLAPKGLIAVAETKVTLHVPGVSMPIPLGFSYSNRTDLLKGSEVRAHIAFSFDTISLARNKNP